VGDTSASIFRYSSRFLTTSLTSYRKIPVQCLKLGCNSLQDLNKSFSPITSSLDATQSELLESPMKNKERIQQFESLNITCRIIAADIRLNCKDPKTPWYNTLLATP
jgi:hypothetical protein